MVTPHSPAWSLPMMRGGRLFCAGPRRRTALIFVMSFTAVLSAGAEEFPPGCRPDAVITGIVASVSDGRTFGLERGGEVRLAAIEVPAPESTLAPGAPQPDRMGTAALAAMIAGKTVSLRTAKSDKDRYGRLVAQVFVAGEGAERWVQGELVAAGLAVVSARVGEPACAAELVRRERAAREAKLGLWADPYYLIGRAEEPAAILAGRGRFSIVEGRVLSVRESGGTIYVNFGRRWSEDFTVTIAKRNARAFSAAGLEPKTLAGRRIRIRGVVEERGGPWIEAARPEQIELEHDARTQK